jgi:NAD(P)-dependent dehydrogenase (short-subunit alcohol dehydrogenase family)
MEGWSDCLRLELNPFGIKVAIIEPGGIMTELGDATMTPLMERSKGGPYQDYVQNFVKNSETSMQQMSPPSVISDLVVKASESKNPKRRYVAGAFAKPLMFLRNWFGDGLMDAILLSQIRN